MAKSISGELTDDLFRRLGGQAIDEHHNKVVLISTLDPNGWPHPAVLSYFEIVATDRSNIRIATYESSNTTQNIRRHGKLTLSIFDERAVYYIKGQGTELCREMRCTPYNSKLNVRVHEVLIDQADPILEPGAYIACGIAYINPDPAAERERGNEILKELIE